MYKTQIAIVDDLQADRKDLTDHIKKYMDAYNLEYTLHEYDNAESFLDDCQNQDFDVVFMDIYMEGISGMEAAVKLRTYDRDCKLVFLTLSEEHLKQAVSLNICHYLNKPIKGEEFIRAMENCCVTPKRTAPTLNVVIGGENIKLDTGRILYIDMVNRTVTIHMTQQTLSVKGTFTKVTEPLLNDARFLLCMKGILVNMDRVGEMTKNAFRMKNGDLVPVNVRNRKAMQTIYKNYIIQRMGGTL